MVYPQEPENHTLFSGTYLFRPNKGVTPPPAPTHGGTALVASSIRSKLCNHTLRHQWLGDMWVGSIWKPGELSIQLKILEILVSNRPFWFSLTRIFGTRFEGGPL